MMMRETETLCFADGNYHGMGAPKISLMVLRLMAITMHVLGFSLLEPNSWNKEPKRMRDALWLLISGAGMAGQLHDLRLASKAP